MSLQPGTPPPFVDPMPVGLENMVIPQAVQEEFVRGILEGMRAEMDMVAQTTGSIEQDWRSIQAMNRQILNETRQAVADIVQLRLSEDQQAQALRAMQDMGIRPELIQQVMETLAQQGQQKRTEEPKSTAAATPEERGDAPRTERPERRRDEKGRFTSDQTEPSPYLDARRAGNVPDEMPDAEGYREARARPPMTWDQGYQMGSRWENLREATANKVNEWWSNRGIAGNLEPPTMDAEGFYTDADGNRTRRAHAAGQNYERAMARRERLAGVISSIGAGEGLSGAASALGGSVARVAGVAGAVYGGVTLAEGLYRNQRDANLEYIGTFGGGVGEALGHRAEEEAFARFGAFGQLDSDQARQLFKGVSALGFEGGERQQALNFATQNYTQFGMDIATSMRLISIANEDGIESLTSYRASLEALAEVAEESGKSIREAHQAYIQAIEQTRQITSGTAAGELAEAFSGIGLNLQSTPLEGVDLTPLMSNQTAKAQAAREMGLDYGEFEARLIQGDKDAVGALVSSTIGDESVLMQAIRSANIAPEHQRRIQQIAAQAPGGVLGTDQFTEIAAVLREAGAWTPDWARSLMGQVGVRMTDAEIAQWIARAYMEDESVNIGGAIEAVDQESDTSARTTMPDGSPIRRSGLDRLIHGKDSAERLQGEWGWVDPDKGPAGWFGETAVMFNELIEGERIFRSGDKYTDMLFSGVLPERMMGLEAFYTQLQDQEKADQYEAAKFEVVKDDGSKRIIGMQDLPTYAREIELGQVSVIQDDRRVPLQDITGYNVAEASERVRQREEEERRKQQEVKVTVEPKGGLSAFLRFQQSGGVEAEYYRSRGLPLPPFGGQLSRWTVGSEGE